VFNILITLAASWQATVVDYDPSIHKYVSLLEYKNSQGAYAVSLESSTPFTFKEGDKIFATIKMECEDGKTIDEDLSDKLGFGFLIQNIFAMLKKRSSND